MANLLQNPGFEGEGWHKTHTGEEIGEVSAPKHWIAYWRDGEPNARSGQVNCRRPECKVIPQEPPYLVPARVFHGEQAWQCFTFFGVHDAGIYQRVEGLTPGARVKATAWTHAWSSNQDNPRHSDTDGGGKWNFEQYVGIDPQGGTDPWAESVVWSNAANVYDQYEQLPPVQAVVGDAGAVTVFLRSVVQYPFKHCDVYWDDASLAVIPDEPEPPDDPGEPGEPQPQPPSGSVDLGEDTRAFIREQVTRVINALQDGSGAGSGWGAETRAYFDAHFQRLLEALTADPRVPIPMDEGGHYILSLSNGVPYMQYLQARKTLGPQEAAGLMSDILEGGVGYGVIPFSQNDPRWADEYYAGGKRFRDYGCLTIGYCMVTSQRYPDVMPDAFVDMLHTVEAYEGAWISRPERIPQAYPLLTWRGPVHWRDVPADLQRLQKEIHDHGPLVCEVLWDVDKPLTWEDASGEQQWNQHFVVVTHIDVPNDEAHVIDPWDGRAKLLTRSRYAEPKSWGAARAVHGMRLLHPKKAVNHV